MKTTTLIAFLTLTSGIAFGQAEKAQQPAPPAAPKAPEAPKPTDPPATIGKPLDYFETTELTTVCTGNTWGEGPLWANGKLYFCDLAAGTVSTIVPGKETKATVIRNDKDRPAGAALDLQGRLLVSHFTGAKKDAEGKPTGGGKITRTEADGTVNIILSEVEGKEIGACNDLVVRSDGTMYTTDFGGGQENRSLIKVSPDGKASILPSTFLQANGVALSPDESILYVAEYKGRTIKAFDLASDGSVSNERVFVDFKEDYTNDKVRGTPDGLKVDELGNIYTTGPGGIWVISPKGEKLARLNVGVAANLAFGGDDRKTLFITAGKTVYSVRTKHAGAAPKGIATPAATPAAKPAAEPAKK